MRILIVNGKAIANQQSLIKRIASTQLMAKPIWSSKINTPTNC